MRHMARAAGATTGAGSRVAPLPLGGRWGRSWRGPPGVDWSAPVLLAMVGPEGGLDVAAHGEVSEHVAVAGLEECVHGAEDDVDDVFVVDVPIAVPVDVQLQRFQLHASWTRHVADVQRREVRKPRYRAEAREFRDRELDRIIALRGSVVEGNERGFADRASPV